MAAPGAATAPAAALSLSGVEAQAEALDRLFELSDQAMVVRVRGLAQVVQASRSLPAGLRLTADDLRLVEVDLATEPAGLAAELDQVVGRELTRPLRENTSLALNALRAATVIKTGDRVTVRVFGRSFQASAEGLAQQAGAVGDTIRVKLADGKQISGSVTGAGQVDVKL